MLIALYKMFVFLICHNSVRFYIGPFGDKLLHSHIQNGPNQRGKTLSWKYHDKKLNNLESSCFIDCTIFPHLFRYQKWGYLAKRTKPVPLSSTLHRSTSQVVELGFFCNVFTILTTCFPVWCSLFPMFCEIY